MNAIPGNFPCAPARWITTSCASLRSWKLCIERRNREHLLSWNNKQIYVQPSGSANFIFTSRSPPYRLINMNATQKPGRKVFQQRFWIRITYWNALFSWLLLEFLVDQIDPFHGFPWWNWRQASGEHVWGMMVSLRTKHWGWDVWYKVKNIFDWYI